MYLQQEEVKEKYKAGKQWEMGQPHRGYDETEGGSKGGNCTTHKGRRDYQNKAGNGNTDHHKHIDLTGCYITPPRMRTTPADKSYSGLFPVASEAAQTLLSRSLSPSVHLSKPERFSGDSMDCRVFIAQCKLHYAFQRVKELPTDTLVS